MANNSKSNTRKKPVSQKRVAIVLASLVGTLTLSAGLLVMMSDGPLGASPYPAFSVTRAELSERIRPPQPLQSSPWNYIIIYESGDLDACADSLADGRSKGVDHNAGLATRLPARFHFVVDSVNSRKGALDGELEIGTSWKNQTFGTPHAGWPDPRYYSLSDYAEYRNGFRNAIGVCVVGDLKTRPYSDAQSRYLLQTVRELQAQHRIRKDSIKFQWELLPNALHASSAQKAYAEDFRRLLD